MLLGALWEGHAENPSRPLSPQGMWAVFTVQTVFIVLKLWTAGCFRASFHELQYRAGPDVCSA